MTSGNHQVYSVDELERLMREAKRDMCASITNSVTPPKMRNYYQQFHRDALALAGVDEAPEREYRFHVSRKWRFDLAWPLRMIAVEIEGGLFSGGAHNRGAHYLSDCDKYNQAAILGWCVLRFSPDQWDTGKGAAVVADAFRARAFIQ